MERKIKMQRALWLLILVIVLTIFCYFFVDKPVAIWISQHNLRSYKFLKNLSKISELFILAAPIFYLIVVSKFFVDRWTWLDQRLLMFANTIAITYFWKVFFKFLFGRTWPETWTGNNPSLIRNDEYGFHFFAFSDVFGSFPSGHAAILLAGFTSLWLIYPRLKGLYIVAIIAGITGILGMNYHFVGDILAGGFLGFAVAYLTSLISNFSRNTKLSSARN